LRSAEFGSHEACRISARHELPEILMRGRKLHKFIIITIIVPRVQDPDTRALTEKYPKVRVRRQHRR
jgi:hypothetical protein